MTNRTKPCKECPFRRGGPAGWLGEATPEGFAASILTDQPLPCHQTVNYARRDWKQAWENGEAGEHCVGSLIMTANLFKISRDPERPRRPADRETVFSTLQEMIDSHRASRVRSWNSEEDQSDDVAHVRAVLRLAPLAPAPAQPRRKRHG